MNIGMETINEIRNMTGIRTRTNGPIEGMLLSKMTAGTKREELPITLITLMKLTISQHLHAPTVKTLLKVSRGFVLYAITILQMV
jgi:hypothetical protein